MKSKLIIQLKSNINKTGCSCVGGQQKDHVIEDGTTKKTLSDYKYLGNNNNN